MARRPEDVQVQIVMPPEMRTEIDEALLKLRDSVPTERLMDRGMMLRFLARWFLSLPRDEQLQAVLAGKAAKEIGEATASRPTKKTRGRALAARKVDPKRLGNPQGEPATAEPKGEPVGREPAVRKR